MNRAELLLKQMRESLQSELKAAGYKVHDVDGKFADVTCPKGTDGIAVKQSPTIWHFFWNKGAASASGHTPKTMKDGGLGDVIDDDKSMRAYKKLIRNAPDYYVNKSDGLAANYDMRD